jgi:hypothetical protein
VVEVQLWLALCRDTKADLDLVGPPTPEEVIKAAAGNIEKSLSTTSADVAKYFETTADKLLTEGVREAKSPTQILSFVMALLSGYTELPKEKSILGQQVGFVTLGIRTPNGRGFTSPGALIGSIRRITDDKTASNIGKVELFDDPEDEEYEAAFDIPRKLSADIVTAAIKNGARLPRSSCAQEHELLLLVLAARTGCVRNRA